MTNFHVPVAIAALAIAASPAASQDYYGSVFAGTSQTQTSDFTGEITPPGGEQSVETSFDDGYNLGFALGRSFGEVSPGVTLRGEVELSFGESDADTVLFSGNGPAAEINVDGGVRSTRLFANALFDFDTGSAFTPYVGGGLGVAYNEFDVSYGPGVALDDSTTDLSLQLIAGSSYALGNGTTLFGDLRYIRDFGTEIDRLAPTGALTGTVEDDLDTVQLNLGLRFAF